MESGRLGELTSSSFMVRRFLSGTSARPVSPIHIQDIVRETETQLLQVTTKRQLEPVDPADMQDARFVTLLYGVRYAKRQGSCFGKLLEAPSRIPCPESSSRTSRHSLTGGPGAEVICLLRGWGPASHMPCSRPQSSPILPLRRRFGDDRGGPLAIQIPKRFYCEREPGVRLA